MLYLDCFLIGVCVGEVIMWAIQRLAVRSANREMRRRAERQATFWWNQ